jgi:cob(I)alamin adenosyltransferase
MKIYTKTGDGGTTALIGGARVDKNHPRVEAYGTVDELMAHTGPLRDSLDPGGQGVARGELLDILGRLMTVASILACEGDTLKKMPRITADDLRGLEIHIDRMTENLPAATRFTLPGGHPLVSLAHIARTVCRRAERRTAALADGREQTRAACSYLTRLSDYFYVLGRKLAADLQAEELFWEPEK